LDVEAVALAVFDVVPLALAVLLAVLEVEAVSERVLVQLELAVMLDDGDNDAVALRDWDTDPASELVSEALALGVALRLPDAVVEALGDCRGRQGQDGRRMWLWRRLTGAEADAAPSAAVTCADIDELHPEQAGCANGTALLAIRRSCGQLRAASGVT
jgi:hypothetical protein